MNHIEGIFPGDYVEILREPKGKKNCFEFYFIQLIILDNSLKQSNQNENNMPKSVLKNPTSSQQTNIVPELSLPKQK